MTNGGNQELMKRIESLERGLEEQRRQLRQVLRRLDPPSGAEATGERGVSTGKVRESSEKSAASERTASRDPRWSTAATNSAEAAADSGHERSRETTGIEDSLKEPGPLAEVFRSRGWGWWLNKVGIGLLLFGVAFLFKFSVDQGWLSPSVRVGFGLTLGVCLLFVGSRVYEGRRTFSQVLLGGGVGTFYITGFAAYTLYELVPHAVAFVFMVATTLLAYTLSVRQDQVALSMIGAIGGFGTPLLLYTEVGGVGELVVYAGLLLAGTVAIYLYKGWRSLLLAAAVGMWTVLLAGYQDASDYGVEISEAEALALQIGGILALMLPWLGSLCREVLRPEEAESFVHGQAPAHLVAVSLPLIFLAFTAEIWSLPATAIGWVAVAAAAIYTLAYTVLDRLEDGGLAYTHALTALMLGTLAVVLLLDGKLLFTALAIQAAVLHLVARRISDWPVAALAHSIFAVLGVWFVGRLGHAAWSSVFDGQDGTPFFNAWTLADLFALLAAVATSFVFVSGRIFSVYRIAAHAGFLALVWREFSLLSDGNAYVTVVWGVYAAVLVVAGLRWDHSLPRQLGLVTLFLVVGKLFLIDLVWVGAMWRILLFLGFGGLFLVLSYYLQALWRQGVPGRGDDDGTVNLREEG